jgi:OmcA/MtrC family decaheme c-type cytochrome
VGSPSLYWVYAVPQDNILKPADFNGSTSVYLRSLWNRTATTSSVGSLSGPDADGYYTATLTGSLIPDNATMLTGGIGYTYGLTTTPPFAQTNVSGFPYGDVLPALGSLAGSARQGGLIVPAADVKKVATGYTGRRQIIDNAKCKNCHVALGANPTFHAGQRNDGESCSWCHNPNQNNSGWSGNAKDMIHALHAGTAAGVLLPNLTFSAGTGKRSFPYTWDAVSQNEGFWEVTFPGPRNNCEACHATQSDPLKHTYDFSATDSAAAVPNLLWSTDATNAVTLQNFVSSVFGSSPYVTTGVDYGANTSVNKGTGVLTAGADTNLVTSPITAACIACHDSPTQKSHIIAMNGQFYVQRAVAKGLTTSTPTDPNQESCLICHGPQPNSIAPIADMHK